MAGISLASLPGRSGSMLKLLASFVAAVADEHDYVRFEPRCVVSEDPGEIVRHACPLDERARRQLLEQHIARLSRERSGRSPLAGRAH
jgi:hypothetical protein